MQRQIFVARTIDSNRRAPADVLRAAAEHEGSALVEIYQNWQHLRRRRSFGLLKDADSPRRRVDSCLVDTGEPDRRSAPVDQHAVVRNAHGGLKIDATSGPRWIDQRDRHPRCSFARRRRPFCAFTLASDPETLHHAPIGKAATLRALQATTMTLDGGQMTIAAEKWGRRTCSPCSRARDTWTID